MLLTGATGYIGRPLAAALAAGGHRLVCAVRDPAAARRDNPRLDYVHADFTRDFEPADWALRVAGLDAVVNAAGIFRERGRQTFDAVHRRAPRALFSACAASGVKVVQISALGADAGAVSRYQASKAAADAFLLKVCTRAVVAQPSIVYGPGGASARLFTALATLPVVPLPGRGAQQLQPIYLDDAVAALAKLLVCDEWLGKRVPLVGPYAVTLRDFLGTLRAAMDPAAPRRFVSIPACALRFVAAAAACHPGSLLDSEALAMLERGNIADAGATRRLLGRPPRPVTAFIPARDAAAAATMARLVWLLPGLRVALAAVWIGSGIVSLGLFPPGESYALLGRAGVPDALRPLALYGAAVLDLAVGLAILAVSRRRLLWLAQFVLILVYTAILTVRLPELWLHPFGPVLKNLPMLAAIWLLYELERRAWTT